MSEFETVLYERPAEHVARIVLNRPDARNAQNTQLLYDLNGAFDKAARDDEVKVIMLAGNGPHFSSGHDLREANSYDNMDDHTTVGTWCGWHCAGAEAQMAREREIYIGFSERWRNIPKPTIAVVQGKVIAGGLMLIWPCDIIIAAEGSMFLDNTVGMGVGGVEYFGHPWEVGARKAKEMLFTADWLSAEDARALGMVNHVVPAPELNDFSLAMAERIAAKPLFALKLAKEAVNAAQDCSGRQNAMQTAFALHHVAHSHNMQVHGMLIDPTGLAPAVKGKDKK
ncbi:MAG: enoyl-CoA hydratase [Minwuia sp.]|nr:enoyl-CoA hydratase [Minwuia sp.]